MADIAAGSNVFSSGVPIDLSTAQVVDQSVLSQPGEYVLQLQGPTFIYNVVGPDTLSSTIRAWLYVQNLTSDNNTNVDITGVSVDTTTGIILVLCTVNPAPTTAQAEINPLLVIGLVLALIAGLGIAATLIAVYAYNAGAQAAGGTPDPCQQPGFFSGLSCWFNRSKWVAVGVVIGVLVVLALIILAAGRAEV